MTVFTYFEPHSDGHCAFWAKHVLKAALHDTRISCVRLLGSQNLIERLPQFEGSEKIKSKTFTNQNIKSMTTGSVISKGLSQWAIARKHVNTVGGFCFIPFFDHAVIGACVDRRFVKGKITGIVFRPPNTYARKRTFPDALSSCARNFIYIASQRPCSPTIMCLDEYFVKKATRLIGGSKRFTFLADPAPDSDLFQGLVPDNRANDRRHYLLFGALSARKGVLAIIDALLALSEAEQQKISLRLMGKFNPEERTVLVEAVKTLVQKAPNLEVSLTERYVTDQELAQAVINADIILAPYIEHVGSSGVILWAAAGQRPLITQNTGLMGYLTKEHELGACTDPKKIENFSQELRHIPNYSHTKMEKMIERHTIKNFTKSIIDLAIK